MVKGKITRAFVGAMKIARPLPVSERHIEWYAPHPRLPQRGSRERLYHSPDYSLKSNVAGDFHRPYETQELLHFTIHPIVFPNHTVSGGDAYNHCDDLKLILDILTKTVILILDIKTGAPKG